MTNFKSILQLMIVGIGMITMIACSNKIETTETQSTSESDILNNDLEGRIPAPEEFLLDNFENGIDPNKWYISTRNWSKEVSNGQLAENVGYTKEGLLVLKANGALYPDDNKRLTGAVLVSKEQYGPGAYEIAMKVLPRLGVCNALWTFYYEDEDFNHEIDIELPGKKSYENVINTNWIGVSDYTSKVTKTLTPANDGKWHKYRFEWTTNPKQIKYYVDDVLTSTITTHVPDYQGRLWLGVWFPKEWTGVPDFEKDYMLVDWVSYEPYDRINQPSYYEEETITGVANSDEYPKVPITLERRNYIANQDFEYKTNAWTLENEDAFITNVEPFQNKYALIVSNQSSASQIITAQYDHYHFNLSFYSKLVNGTGGVTIDYLDEHGEVISNSTVTISVEKDNYDRYENEFTTVEGTKAIKLTLYSNSNSILLFDDIKLILK